jgi:hypothetical protein
VDFLLGQDVPYLSYEADSPAWGKDWIALVAVNRWGFGGEMKVRETVHALLENTSLWLEGQDGRAASAILRGITLHPLMEEQGERELIIGKLRERQLPGGSWDLGPGTSQLAVIAALIPLAEDPRVNEQINRFLPTILDDEEGFEDTIFSRDEAHFVILQALKLAGKLESYRRGENLGQELAPYEIGLYVVARAGEKGHTLTYQGETITVTPEPVLLGTEISRWREVLSPVQDEAPLLRLFLGVTALEKLDRLLAADSAVEVALLLRNDVIAIRPLSELREQEGLAVKGLADEDAARLVEAVSRGGGMPAAASMQGSPEGAGQP